MSEENLVVMFGNEDGNIVGCVGECELEKEYSFHKNHGRKGDK